MKFITVGKLNRFWKNGVKPIKNRTDALYEYLAFKDIRSSISLKSGVALLAAFTENGMVTIKVRMNATSTLGTHQLFQVNDSTYFPKTTIEGNIGIHGTSNDRASLFGAQMNAAGLGAVGVASATQAAEDIYFMYPARRDEIVKEDGNIYI